ncbi:amino acid ABC transporter permease [Candidatus Bipolaricaulota bacterium]|nr:amino acid ABC transporter permease [Candidatus Bipolaricaulota bacterium]MBS3825796.1 amino acid ABC transporter permease [Candidatus Bipolaricaulota bacterium]
MEDLILIWNSLPALLKGMLVTLELTLAFLGLGFLVGIVFAFGQVYGNKFTQTVIAIYEKVFRAIPALVLLFLFYFGSASLGIKLSAFISACLAMGLRSSAYQSQIFRGAIQSVGKEQMMASRSLGMSQFKSIVYVILPQILRLSIPSWTNEFAIVLKDTSLVYALGITEMLRQGRYIIARTYGNSLLIYITVAVIYFILVFTGSKFFSFLEKKFKIPGYETKEEKEGVRAV